MRFNLLIVNVLFLCASVAAASAEVTGPTCVDLAKTIGTGYSKSFSSEQLNALEWYRNCEASSDAPSGGLALGYEGFNIGVKWSDDKRKQQCTEDYKDKHISNIAYSSVKNIFKEAIGPIEECLKLAANSWQINYQLIGHDSLSVTVANNNGTGNFVSGVQVIPPESMTCKGIPSEDKFPITVKNGPTETLSIVCNRTPHSQTIDGITFTSADDTALDLQLANQPFILPLPGYKSSIWDDISSRINSSVLPVSNTLSTLKGSLSSWPTSPAVAGNAVGGGDGRPATMCPAGQYAVGLNWWGAPGSTRYCIGCASGVQIICQPLNIPK